MTQDTETRFEIGMIFSPEYPPEAADWCNLRGDCYIGSIEPSVDGTPRWKILPVQPPTEDERMEWLREMRNRMLSDTDYLIMPDYPLDEESKQAIIEYRQKLRDLPEQDGAPWDGGGEETPWPEMPKK